MTLPRDFLGKPIPFDPNRRTNGNGAAEVWGKPQELPPASPSVPEMPPDLVPEQYRAWVEDACDRAQVPLDMICAPALVATGSLIGRSIGIYPKRFDDWCCVPNLWGAVIGRPGILKSPALNEGLRPLRALSAKAADEFKEKSYQSEAEKIDLKARLDAAKGDAAGAAKSKNEADREIARREIADLLQKIDTAEAHERRLTTNDVTVEALGEILKHNPRGVLLFRDELVGLLKTWEKPGRESDRSFFLECWNGDGEFSFDRIGRGTIHIPSTTVSICGGMTPGKLRAYTSDAAQGGAGDDGLLQRFQILVWPEPARDWVNIDRRPDARAYERVTNLFDRLDTLDPLAIGAEDGRIPGLRFSDEAQELFDAWREDLEMRLRGADDSAPSFVSHLAKYRSLMPSLALIYPLLAVLEGSESGPVSIAAAQLAARWCDFLECHARKVYAHELCGDAVAASHLAERIRDGSVKDGVTVRDIYRNGWKELSTPDAVWTAVEALEMRGWLRVHFEGRGGQRKDILKINPALNPSPSKNASPFAGGYVPMHPGAGG